MSTGIVYLIQPCELINTNRYKIGMSRKSDLSRMKAYKNGTRYLFICERQNVLEVEKRIINSFNERYKRIAGREYFEIDEPEENMIEYFISIVMNNKKNNYVDPDPINDDEDIQMEDCSNYEQSVPVNNLSWMERFSFKTS